jgi:ELP3 family radical SAM enzyme/protein acetyltransferase
MCLNPDYDLESFERSIDEHLQKEFRVPTEEEALGLKPLLKEIATLKSLNNTELHKILCKYKATQYKKNSFLIQALHILLDKGEFPASCEDHIKDLLRIKRVKSHSGIMSVTIFTSPYPEYTNEKGERKKQMFSCNFLCSFCPSEKNQPKSYLLAEPGVLRANRYGFDSARQTWGRLTQLLHMGHNLRNAKLEVLVLGGTWTSYPWQYREEFIRDMYYAANTFFDREKRERLSLKEEKIINRDAMCRVIGLTVEFRPDSINRQELLRLRSYGCTRVQLGIQHLDNDILKGINRQCTTERFMKSLKLLKDCCYKIDIHIMPNLPFSSPEKDKWMMERFTALKTPTKIFYDETLKAEWEIYDIVDPDISADQWKLYPCETVPYTEIEKWFREGTYVPYPKDVLYNLLYETKKKVYPWVRCNRIIRDIPKGYIIASSDDPNTGQVLLDDLKKRGDKCMCIRCREVKEKTWDGTYKTVIRHYKASGGDEYFISAESHDKFTLYGFLRLRLSQPAADIFPELENCALVRELHVYSNMNPVGEDINTIQHRGIGKHLLHIAECIAKKNNYPNIAVISGIGVQKYYEKRGYHNDSEGVGDFMIKYL